MKPNTIELFPDGRIGAYEMPEKFKVDDKDSEWYKTTGGYMSPFLWNERKLEAAKREAVYFKPEHKLLIISKLFDKEVLLCHGMEMQVGKSYPVPDGYTIEIKSEYVEPPDSIHCNRGYDRKYAILVPKQFHCGDEEDVDVRCEKQCDRCKGYKIEHSAGDDYPVIENKKRVEVIVDGKTESIIGTTDLVIVKVRGDVVIEMESAKQQSIEEAAEVYGERWNGGDILSSVINAFIAGAKSQAAKEYWYEQFKQEKL